MSEQSDARTKRRSLKGMLLSRITVGVYCPKTGRRFQREQDELACSECGGDLTLKSTVGGGADYGHK